MNIRLAVVVVLLWSALALEAQDPSAMEHRLHEQLDKIQQRIQSLYQLERVARPAIARRLERANRVLQERAILDRIAVIRDDISNERFDEALTRIRTTATELGEVLDALLDRNAEFANSKNRTEKLSAIRDRVRSLLQDQRQLRAEVANSTEPAPLAERQRQLSHRAAELARQMRANDAEERPPGSHDVHDAATSARRAAQSLADGEKRDRAVAEQEATENALTRADGELSRALANAEGLEERALQRILQDFLESMLSQQIEISNRTSQLATFIDHRTSDQERSDDLIEKTRMLAADERALHAQAQSGLDRLTDAGERDGVVFVALASIAEDLDATAMALDAQSVGAVTQELQQGVESAIRELLEAMGGAPTEPENPDKPEQGEEQQDGDRELFSIKVQLKILLSMQQRIRRRTEVADRTGDSSQLKQLAERQQGVEQLTRTLADRLAERAKDAAEAK